MHSIDADETAPTPSHMALLAACIPRPDRVVARATSEHDVAVSALALWIADLRGHLGQFIAQAVLQDEPYVARATVGGKHLVLCVATTVDEATAVLRELLPDLLTPTLSRPPGTIPVIIGDRNDDVRVVGLDRAALSTTH